MEKRLNQCAQSECWVELSGDVAVAGVDAGDAAASFGCKIEYRTDDTAPWTDAGTESNTLRASVNDLTDSFYTVQLRITLDDDTGNDEDIRVAADLRGDAISVIYTIEE